MGSSPFDEKTINTSTIQILKEEENYEIEDKKMGDLGYITAAAFRRLRSDQQQHGQCLCITGH
jgi:hypothetical protein